MGEHRCTQASPPRPVGGAAAAALCVHDMLWECYVSAYAVRAGRLLKSWQMPADEDASLLVAPETLIVPNNRNCPSPAALLSFQSNTHTQT